VSAKAGKSPNLFLGVDYHPSFQTIAFFKEETGECGEQELNHSDGQAEKFYRDLKQRGTLSMNEGYRWKKRLFSEQGRAQLERLWLAPWASRRRQELLELLDRMNPTIEELTAAVEREARKRPEALRLMTHPGVGPLTALA